jgi:signal transduction histidine kinase
MLGSTSLRLAALYTAGFALAVALLGLVTMLATRSALTQQFDSRIRNELLAVEADYNEGGLKGLLVELKERKGSPDELLFGVQTALGEPIAGRLAGLKAPAGWSEQQLTVEGRVEHLRVLTQEMAGGYRLLGGDKASRIEALSRRILLGFFLAFAGVLVVGAVGAFALSRAVQRRLTAISGTAEAIIDGDMARRIPVSAGDDDLTRLAATINRMLDRISGLMDSLRQVSSDIAHDLRTPLNRLHQRLELAARRAHDPDHRAEIEGALRDVDAILATFAAMLRIAEVEAGARRAAFRRLDLQALARAVVDDFGPAAEDGGHALVLDGAKPVWIEGDDDLLTQMTVNLVENALRHTPRGCTVRLSAALTPDGAMLSVADDGPGVPAAERERLFDRFYRLERSRSTPGSGLGLALVQAVARLHRGEIALSDRKPGLEARVVFPAATS